jgi:hypothetical protein
MSNRPTLTLRAARIDPAAGSPDALALLAYWQDKRAGRRFPARADIDPLELRRFIGDISLIDVRRAPLDFVYRIAGTRLAGDAGYDLTGRSVREIRPAAWADFVFEQLSEALAAATPRLHRIELRVGGDAISYLRLTLPLGQDDTVSMLLTLSERPHGFREFMAQLEG